MCPLFSAVVDGEALDVAVVVDREVIDGARRQKIEDLRDGVANVGAAGGERRAG